MTTIKTGRTIMRRHQSDHRLTRRVLVAGVAVGTFALAGEPASAQRCPAVPPPRQKGPLVWLDMDQQDLDDAYDQDVYAYNSKNIGERRVYQNEIVRAVLDKPQREAYGPTEVEKL